MMNLNQIHRVAGHILRWLAQHSLTMLRLSMGVVFLGFGILKFFPDLSPAADLAGQTFNELTLGIVPENVGLVIVAAVETVIGVTLLTGRLLRVGLVLLGIAMVGVLSPLVLLPETLFRGAVWAPTLAGQYVIKDVVLLAVTVALASSVFARQSLGISPPPRSVHP
jgi:putative oxidoreductase